MDISDSSEDDEFAAMNRAGSRAAGKAKRGELCRLPVHCPGLMKATDQCLTPSQANESRLQVNVQG